MAARGEPSAAAGPGTGPPPATGASSRAAAGRGRGPGSPGRGPWRPRPCPAGGRALVVPGLDDRDRPPGSGPAGRAGRRTPSAASRGQPAAAGSEAHGGELPVGQHPPAVMGAGRPRPPAEQHVRHLPRRPPPGQGGRRPPARPADRPRDHPRPGPPPEPGHLAEARVPAEQFGPPRARTGRP